MTIVATCAFEGTYEASANLAVHHSRIDEAADAGAGLVVFPECSLHGYPDEPRRNSAAGLLECWERAETVTDANPSSIAEHAADRGIHVVYGMHERSATSGVFYNTAVLTGPHGHIGRYRKVHLGASETAVWAPGSEWPVFDTAIGRIGMLICGDMAWPESTRELTLGGAEVLVMPTAWWFPTEAGQPSSNSWTDAYFLFDRVRAADNSRWFISANMVGPLGSCDYPGFSEIVDPFGAVVTSTGNAAGLALADVDVAGGIARVHAQWRGPRLLRERRSDTYRIQRGELPVVIDG